MTVPPQRWRLRRRITYWTLAYCGVFFAWIVLFGKPDSLREAALEILGMLAFSVIASYTGAKTILNLKELRNVRSSDNN